MADGAITSSVIGMRYYAFICGAVLASLSFVQCNNRYFQVPESKEYIESKVYTKYGNKKDYFGYAVSIGNEWLISGAYSSSSALPYAGAVFPFRRNDTWNSFDGVNKTTWVENDKIVAIEARSHDYFGGSVAVWKSTLVVGAYLDEFFGVNSGSAFVFEHKNSEWVEVQRIFADVRMSADYFGQAVDVFNGVIVIGAHGWAIDGIMRGAIYVFLQQPNRQWTQNNTIVPSDSHDYQMFGFSVAVKDSIILVGAYGDSAYGSNTGALYVFDYDNINATYTRIGKLLAADPRAHSNFGISVAITRDSNIVSYNKHSYTLAVGASMATGYSSATGAVYLYHCVPSKSSYHWSYQSKLYPNDVKGEVLFGVSVAIDYDILLVGASEDYIGGVDSGAAYVYIKTYGKWSIDKKLVGNDTMQYDNYGCAVDVNENFLAVGAAKSTGIMANTGSVYVYEIRAVAAKKERKPYINLPNKKNQFILIITLLPMLGIVILPLCVYSTVVQYKQYRNPIDSYANENIDYSNPSATSSTHGLLRPAAV